MGVLLYALLCGFLPFDDENTFKLYKLIQVCKLNAHFDKQIEVFPSNVLSCPLVNNHVDMNILLFTLLYVYWVYLVILLVSDSFNIQFIYLLNIYVLSCPLVNNHVDMNILLFTLLYVYWVYLVVLLVSDSFNIQFIYFY